MKKLFLSLGLLITALTFSTGVFAQKNIEKQIERDPILEADAKHNLEVARNYFKLKKAYKAVLMRFEETFASYPDFSKMDEFLYYAGMSCFYLSDNKGRQKATAGKKEEREKYAPEKMREGAKMYLTMLSEKYPDSAYKESGDKTLKLLDAKE